MQLSTALHDSQHIYIYIYKYSDSDPIVRGLGVAPQFIQNRAPFLLHLTQLSFDWLPLVNKNV